MNDMCVFPIKITHLAIKMSIFPSFSKIKPKKSPPSLKFSHKIKPFFSGFLVFWFFHVKFTKLREKTLVFHGFLVKKNQEFVNFVELIILDHYSFDGHGLSLNLIMFSQTT